MSKQQTETAYDHWWGQYSFALNQTGHWQVGASSLAITRLETEWQIQHLEKTLPEEGQNGWAVDLPGTRLDDDATVRRHLFQNTSSNLRVQPALADRPVVSRPVTPVHLSPRTKTTIFVSSPIWLVVSTIKPDLVLFDMPHQRPSDTWFGPSTWEGELCYAVRTRARLLLAETQLRPHRSVTSISIHNKGETIILLERLKLPVRHLALYTDAEGMLWTSDVTIVTEEEMASAELHIDRGVPRHANAAKLVTKARDRVESHVVRRALHTIFS